LATESANALVTASVIGSSALASVSPSEIASANLWANASAIASVSPLEIESANLWATVSAIASVSPSAT
jgi:hypothetical protein